MLSDTHPAIRARLIEGYRRMTPEQKLAIVDDLNRTVKALAAARQRLQYPDDTPEQARPRLASLWLPRELMIRRFGWDPLVEGR